MHVTGRLCCVWLDTTGREITVRRPAETTEDGWLHHGTPIEIKKGQVGSGDAGRVGGGAAQLLNAGAFQIWRHGEVLHCDKEGR